MDSKDLNKQLAELKAKREVFFNEAFSDSDGKPYNIPPKLRKLSERLCLSYGINGICDPMYIANVIAVELGLGDGMSNFN